MTWFLPFVYLVLFWLLWSVACGLPCVAVSGGVLWTIVWCWRMNLGSYTHTEFLRVPINCTLWRPKSCFIYRMHSKHLSRTRKLNTLFSNLLLQVSSANAQRQFVEELMGPICAGVCGSVQSCACGLMVLVSIRSEACMSYILPCIKA